MGLLQELSGKYEEQCSSGVEKEVTLSQAVDVSGCSWLFGTSPLCRFCLELDRGEDGAEEELPEQAAAREASR